MQSETIGALAAALAKAQGEISPAVKDRTAKITQTAGYGYATLASLWESARAALSSNGLAVTQVTDFDSNGEIVLITTLLHSSGEWMGGVYPIRTADTKPQTLGSALTYARRYAFGALVGLTSDDDDDDGNGAQNGTNGGAQQQTRPAAAAPNGTATGKVTANGSAAKGDDEREMARKSFMATGSELFGEQWEDARHWLVQAYTLRFTPDKVRKSSTELGTTELRDMAKMLKDDGAKYVDSWGKYRAKLDGITVSGAQEMAH